MSAASRPFLRTVLLRGVLAFGLPVAILIGAWAAIQGDVPAWPHWLLEYGSMALIGGVLYGCFWWWIERRYAR